MKIDLNKLRADAEALIAFAGKQDIKQGLSLWTEHIANCSPETILALCNVVEAALRQKAYANVLPELSESLKPFTDGRSESTSEASDE